MGFSQKAALEELSTIGLSDSNIQLALDGFFGNEEDPSPLDERVKDLLLSFEGSSLSNAQKACRYMFAELTRVTSVKSVEHFFPVIEQMCADMEGFQEYSALLREYARQRKSDLTYLETDEIVGETAEAYARLCEEDPENLLERRRFLDKLKREYTLGLDHLSWANDMSVEVLKFLSEAENELKKLEKAERVSARLKRVLSEEGIDVKKELDEADHYRQVNQILEKTQKFSAFDPQDRDYLLVEAYDRLQELLKANVVELEAYFEGHFGYISREKSGRLRSKTLEEVKEAFREACRNNRIFKDEHAEKWAIRFRSLAGTPQRGFSCVRAMVIMVLASALGVGFGTFDMWKQSFGFQFPDPQSILNNKKSEKKDTDIAPVDSSTRQQLDEKK